MCAYRKKKKNELHIDRALERLAKSRATARLKKRREGLLNNPEFNKELNELMKEYPVPPPDLKVKACLYLDSQVHLHGMEVHGELEEMIKYSKPWKAFCEKWCISYPGFVYGKRIDPLPVVEIGKWKIGEHKGKPCMTLLSKDATEQDIKDYAPLFMEMKYHCFGETPLTQGRDSKEAIFRKIRSEYKERIQNEKSNVIINSLAKKFNLKPERVYRIVYTKKYDDNLP